MVTGAPGSPPWNARHGPLPAKLAATGWVCVQKFTVSLCVSLSMCVSVSLLFIYFIVFIYFVVLLSLLFYLVLVF